MKQSEPVIQLTRVSKKYDIHHEKPTLVEKFFTGKNEAFWALRDISLNINKGERIGIIGPNGSGKTTLLKILAGITNPTSGSVRTKGKIVSLIDLQAGFHADLTGYQNIFLNGMLLGLTKAEIVRKIPSIIRFADIRQFIDAPLFTYSSGMILRLGFAIAVHTDPDIIIIDENLTVGDKYFQKKANTKLDGMFAKNRTFIIVSHMPDVLKQYCQRYIVLENGSITHDGGSSVLASYIRRV